jgi:uncharacterized damage-inducible protein DinB
VRSFLDEDLAFRVSSAARSIGELIAYVADSYGVTEHWLNHERPRAVRLQARLASIEQALIALRDGQQSLFRALDELSADRFFDVIAPFGMPEHRGVMALGMFKHELHYRGELYALARLRGRNPPGLYA